MTLDLEDRIQRLEWTVRGPNGDNGLVAEVRALRRDLHAWREKDAAERKADMRWRLGFSLSIIVAILSAAAIVSTSI